MKVREILCAAAGMLGRADAAAFLTDGVGADVRALEGEVSALLRAYNLTESETALVYRPLRLSEKVSSADGTIAYSVFSERPVNVEKVWKEGEEINFTLLADALKTAAGEVEVLYRRKDCGGRQRIRARGSARPRPRHLLRICALVGNVRRGRNVG